VFRCYTCMALEHGWGGGGGGGYVGQHLLKKWEIVEEVRDQQTGMVYRSQAPGKSYSRQRGVAL
jgi:hypothetical protein